MKNQTLRINPFAKQAANNLTLKPMKGNTVCAKQANLRGVSVITDVDTKGVVINRETLLSLSAKEFTTVIANDLDKCNLHGYSPYGFISSLGWALKFGLSSLSRSLTNDFSLFVCTLVDKRAQEKQPSATIAGSVVKVKEGAPKGTLKDLTAKDASAIAARAGKIADAIESLYGSYAFHAEAISNMSAKGFELHPFMRRMEASFELNNDLDGGFWDDNEPYSDEDYMADTFTQEGRARAFEREMDELMAPAEGARWNKANLTAARDAAPKAVYEEITREEFIHDLIGRSMTEHREVASFATWKAIGALIERLMSRYGQPLEGEERKYQRKESMLHEMFPYGIPQKKLSLILKLRNKRWSVNAQILYLIERIEWLEHKIDVTDDDETQLTIAAQNNARDTDDLYEARIQLENALAQKEVLDAYVPEFNRLLSHADLRDQETGEKFVPPMFSFYANFDVVEFIGRQLKAKKRLEGINLADKAAYNEAWRALGKPQVSVFTSVQPTVDSRTGEITEKPTEIHSLSYTADVDYTELVKRLGDIRRKHAQTDKAQHMLRMLAATHKQMGMKNKKVSTADVEDLMASFNEARFEHLGA